MDGYALKFKSISPHEIPASRLGDLIKQYEIAVKKEYLRHSGKSIQDSDLVALKSIEANCTVLRFIAAPALCATAALVISIPKPNSYIPSNYPSDCRRFYEQIYDIGSNYNTAIESFQYSQTNDSVIKILSEISMEDTAQMPSTTLKSKKTMYGEVIQVGGKQPKVRIKLDNGDIVSCIGDKDIVCKAAGFLYNSVRFSGIAKTHFSLGSPYIQSFVLKDIQSFTALPAADLINRLKPHISKQLDRLDDQELYFQELREGNE